MDMPLDLATLQAMPVFGALESGALDHLLTRCRTVQRAPGEVFFGEGEPATSLFVLLAGRAECTRLWQGQVHRLREFGPGDCFGEMALMDFQPRSATLRALQPCQALEVPPDALHALAHHDLQAFALLQMNLGREISRRLRDTDEALFQARVGRA